MHCLILVLSAIALLAPIAVLDTGADGAKQRGVLMTTRSVSEGATRSGGGESQSVTEIRLSATVARQDNYAGGLKGKPSAHTTTLYFPNT
jgi:hypothetical protein